MKLGRKEEDAQKSANLRKFVATFLEIAYPHPSIYFLFPICYLFYRLVQILLNLIRLYRNIDYYFFSKQKNPCYLFSFNIEYSPYSKKGVILNLL